MIKINLVSAGIGMFFGLINFIVQIGVENYHAALGWFCATCWASCWMMANLKMLGCPNCGGKKE